MENQFFLLDQDTLKAFSSLYPESWGTGFSEDMLGIGCIADGKPAGLLMATVSNDLIWLDWLYVKPEYRKNCIGISLLRILKDNTAFTVTENRLYAICSDEETRDFLIHRGFSFSDPVYSDTYKSYNSTLGKLKDLSSDKADFPSHSLSALDKQEINMLNNYFFQHPDVTLGVSLPIEPSDYMEESQVLMRDNMPKSMLLLRQEGDVINVAYAFLNGKNGAYLAKIIETAREELLKKYSEDTPIKATALNEASEKMIGYFFAESEVSSIYTGSMFMM